MLYTVIPYFQLRLNSIKFWIFFILLTIDIYHIYVLIYIWPHCGASGKCGVLTTGLPEWSESHSVMSDSLGPHGLFHAWNSPGQNTGRGSLSLLQGIFPIQGLNSGLPHCRKLSHKGSQRSPCNSPFQYKTGLTLVQSHARSNQLNLCEMSISLIQCVINSLQPHHTSPHAGFSLWWEAERQALGW